MKALLLGLLLSVAIAPVAKALDVSQDVVCYRYVKTQLVKRDLCRMTNYDTSAKLTWSNRQTDSITWGYGRNGYSLLNNVETRTYYRNSYTLEITKTYLDGYSFMCLQRITDQQSICYR